MFETIIWATDGSEVADHAFSFAKELAAREDATLIVLHCSEVFVGRAGGWPVRADEEEVTAKIRAQADEARSEGLDARVQIVSCAAPHAARVIAEVALGKEADAIVVGTRGHSPVAGLLMDSVSQRLLHLAPCPVLAVPPESQMREHGPRRDAAEVGA